MKVDFHTHILPPVLKQIALQSARRKMREWMRPVSSGMHKVQTLLRHLPDPARKRLDQVSSLAPLPGLLFESTAQDLVEAMSEANLDFAVVIAHPPYSNNDFILETCQQNPKLIPAVNIPSGTARPGQKLRKLRDKGAKILKIHPAADGEGADSPRYRALLKSAADLGMPVILHTGCIHSNVLYKDPMQGQVQRFSNWFKDYPSISFVLAHMNYHEPQIALDLLEEFSNLYVDTSWQPAEMIAEASRRVGADRVLFGTDWPIVGQNIAVGIQRIEDCVQSGILEANDAQLILGKNAARLMGLHATST